MMDKRTVKLYLTDSESLYQQALAEAARVAISKSDIELEVSFAERGSSLRQIQEIVGDVHHGLVHTVIVMPVKDGSLQELARSALSRDIGWIVLNRSINLGILRNEFSKGLIARVTPDQRAVGRLQGEQFKSLLPQGGSAVYIQGDMMTSAAADRTAGLKECIEGSHINLTCINGYWSREKAKVALTNWFGFTHGFIPVDLVGCQNDEMALGAMDALRDASSEIKTRLSKIASTPITGCDGVSNFGQRLVNDGKLAATVILPVTAGKAVEMAVRFLKNGEVPPEETVLKPEPYPAFYRRHPAVA